MTTIKTYQDLQAAVKAGTLNAFLELVIDDHKRSTLYRVAVDAEKYDAHQNVTITEYQKLLYTVQGKAVPDNYSANHKVASNFFNRFVVQETQYLLGNGANFKTKSVKDKLGGDAFDIVLQRMAQYALVGGVSFGFVNLDHVECFRVTEFAPLFDEETGALAAGVRFWQLDTEKPMRATLYTVEGYTDYIKRSGKSFEELRPLTSYKQVLRQSQADGVEILAGENYDSFPIVPLWGNPHHQSELTGIREQIDSYDLIKSGFANDLDDASMIYWTLTNTGGMDDVDLAKFIQRMKTVRAAAIEGDSGSNAEAHTLDIPYQSREAYLSRLEKDMYRDFMALDVAQIAAGNITATQIRAAYDPLNSKADQFEYCVLDFLAGAMAVLGLSDTVTFKRSTVVNQLEETQMVLMAAAYLDDKTILKKLPWISEDEIKGIMDARQAEGSIMPENPLDQTTTQEVPV